MTHIEKVKHVREATFLSVSKVNDALKRTDDDVDAAIALLIKENNVSREDMANRVANARIVYSYVHNNRIGAMVVMACQTDFVAKNERFLALAKDICMHIVSAPNTSEWVDVEHVPEVMREAVHVGLMVDPKFKDKPEAIRKQIADGKLKKMYTEKCLLKQPFVKDDTKTVGDIINEAVSVLGEKIEVLRFVKMVAQ